MTSYTRCSENGWIVGRHWNRQHFHYLFLRNALRFKKLNNVERQKPHHLVPAWQPDCRWSVKGFVLLSGNYFTAMLTRQSLKNVSSSYALPPTPCLRGNLTSFTRHRLIARDHGTCLALEAVGRRGGHMCKLPSCPVCRPSQHSFNNSLLYIIQSAINVRNVIWCDARYFGRSLLPQLLSEGCWCDTDIKAVLWLCCLHWTQTMGFSWPVTVGTFVAVVYQGRPLLPSTPQVTM